MKKKYNTELTIEKILSVSEKLFNEKGYEKTSVQNIVDELGMSKGAIFHHFKSKKDIFNTIVKKQSLQAEHTMDEWVNSMKNMSAKEKLISILNKNLHDQALHDVDDMLTFQMSSPQFVLSYMRSMIDNSAPFFAKIMREGMEDGSITTKYPDECAEVFFLLVNIWCDPIIFNTKAINLKKRLEFLQDMMKNMGADIVTDEILEQYIAFLSKLHERVIRE